jgi:phage/plasmid-like protein (TIGR03299 family)
MPAEVETMFSARQVPWHGLGKITADVLTAADAIKAAGLDWEIEKEQVERKGKPVPNKFWNVRTTDDKIMGMVSGDFNNLQNREAFTFVDNLVDSGDAKYETAGALRGGRVVFMTVKMPKTILVAGEDLHEFYIVFRMGHDGTMAVTAEVTPIRVVCMNTLKMASAMAQQRWSIRHTSTMEGKLAAARESLSLSYAYADEFVVMGNQLVATEVTDDMLVKLLEDTMPNRPKTPEAIDHIMELFRESDNIANYRNTGWGAMNAFTEYTDHGRGTRSQEAVFNNIMNGEIASQRDRLAGALLSI